MSSKTLEIHLDTGAVLHTKLSEAEDPATVLEICRDAMRGSAIGTVTPVAIMSNADGDHAMCIDWSHVVAVLAVDYLN